MGFNFGGDDEVLLLEFNFSDRNDVPEVQRDDEAGEEIDAVGSVALGVVAAAGGVKDKAAVFVLPRGLDLDAEHQTAALKNEVVGCGYSGRTARNEAKRDGTRFEDGFGPCAFAAGGGVDEGLPLGWRPVVGSFGADREARPKAKLKEGWQ